MVSILHKHKTIGNTNLATKKREKKANIKKKNFELEKKRKMMRAYQKKHSNSITPEDENLILPRNKKFRSTHVFRNNRPRVRQSKLKPKNYYFKGKKPTRKMRTLDKSLELLGINKPQDEYMNELCTPVKLQSKKNKSIAKINSQNVTKIEEDKEPDKLMFSALSKADEEINRFKKCVTETCIIDDEKPIKNKEKKRYIKKSRKEREEMKEKKQMNNEESLIKTKQISKLGIKMTFKRKSLSAKSNEEIKEEKK
jgi:hypothetical protein